jgi:Protein of unknown function (DUF1572)
MLIETLKSIFTRDLNKLLSDIELYQNEKNLWLIEKNIANSAGNLCLHLIGNLNSYIGEEFGKTNYIRNRDLEFLQKDIPRAELISKINETILIVNKSLDQLTEEDLKKNTPFWFLIKKHLLNTI